MAKGFVAWVDARLPVFSKMEELGWMPLPRNLNLLWAFGAVCVCLLLVMLVSGIYLAMHYVAHVDHAFDSVAALRNGGGAGAFMLSLHHHGASFLFAALYVHLLRGMYYGSFKKPRELVWVLGALLFVMMMKVAFMGVVLPWNQSGYWSAQVVTNLLSEVPWIGETLVQCVRGGEMLGTPTLSRFFLWHVLMPCLILAFVVLHVVGVHAVGANNPTGNEKVETRAFYPFYFLKHLVVTAVIVAALVGVTICLPSWGVAVDALVPADATTTPETIVPAWYLMPFYGILRVVTFDLSVGGVTVLSAGASGALALLFSIVVLFALPWLDRHPIKSGHARGWFYQGTFIGFVASVFALGYAGGTVPDGWPLVVGRIGLVYYFTYFLIALPWMGRRSQRK